MRGRRIIDKKVVVYSTPTALTAKGQRITSTVREFPTWATLWLMTKIKPRECLEKSGQMSVSVITVDDEIVIGFNQALLDKLLP